MKKLSIALIICILWMGYIFYNSSLTSKESGAQSNIIVDTIRNEKSTLKNIANNLLSKQKQEEFKSVYNKVKININTIVRKSAHAIEFCILALIVSFVFYSLNIKGINRFIYTLFIVLLWATLDEFHQLFVPGRGSSVKDILIDFSGGIVGVIVFNFITFIVNKFKNKKARTVITRG